MNPRDSMPTTNTNGSPNGPRDSLSDYEFSFETYLDYKSRIEIDSNPWTTCTNLDTASVAESIYEFHKENGRTYHAYRAGSYLYPNDSLEVERLDTQYNILKILLDGRACLSPFTQASPPHKVLDIATGSGCWAIDMGDEFPEARIIGTDLSPIQTNLVPPNVEFIIDDATDEWPQGRDWCNFDLIHTRATLGCWSDMKTQIIEPAFERLKPGGWMECQELMGLLESDDDTLTDDNPFKLWCDNIVEASILANRPLNFAASMKQWFIEVGFVDITEKVYKLPLNGWPKDRRLKRFGELWHSNMASGLQAFSYGLLHRVKGWTKEQIEVNLVDVRKAMADQRMHSYEKFYVVYGRKPDTA
ncbi:S-adenosyl-L-methionine-dependent methyltransferase [Fusarium tricinctum]|uniref:S-adenosyl-L-methionine-dependent methyltransferase n=1 Tax=Fusarium tricinctum TaxID=61284 RepID=A0A8K0S0I3_9HYPO|nr:S-adenosyl-L-methionine-dependent methyltransferase [Fusarium tricinctum]